MKFYIVKYRFPIPGGILITPGASEALGGSMIIEAEDEEFAKDELLYRLYHHPLSPTHPSGGVIKPVITSVEEVID
jgi:hypothetical protein